MIKRYTEVLAPVGGGDMLIAAVRSGADAVYFGAKDFSARRNAENFTAEQLKNAIEYCHIRGVKAYLTLNILIKDSEMTEAVNLAKTAYNCGIDGVIIEDIGLAGVLKNKIPDLALHASTQMSVHTASALYILKDMGFSRVVAAREMSKTDLAELCKLAKELDIEVEVFVHGALCMSVSGQCLLSAFLGSRSGNRGLCAGPCRLPFSAQNGTGYDLSLKDLSLLPYLTELANMGVTSFKIEGRMKRPEYVAAATFACRESLDKGKADIKIEGILKSVFSRSGFTDGYYTDKLGKAMFGIRTKEDVLSASDAFPQIHELYRAERRVIKLDLDLTVKRDKPITLILSDGENTVTAEGEVPSAAKNKAADEQSLKSGIDKFGSTPYILKNITINSDEGLFVPASLLNELRRSAVDKLNLLRASSLPKKSDAEYTYKKPVIKRKMPAVYIRVEDQTQLPEDLSGISAVIFPLEKEFGEKPKGVRLIADIPRGILSERLISERLKIFKAKGFKEALCGNLSAVKIAKDEGFKIIADTGLNVYNSESAAKIGELGADEVVLSSEILLSDANLLSSPIPKGIIAYGNIPLMLFKNCPLKNGKSCKECDKNGVITDRKNTSFPIRCRLGYSEMLNSVPIWLADKANELTSLDFTLLYFTKEDKETVSEVINAYKNGANPKGEYTRGLYFRGLI